MQCARCNEPAVTLVRYSGQHLCPGHFREFVERRVKREIHREAEFGGYERIAIGLSGGTSDQDGQCAQAGANALK